MLVRGSNGSGGGTINPSRIVNEDGAIVDGTVKTFSATAGKHYLLVFINRSQSYPITCESITGGTIVEYNGVEAGYIGQPSRSYAWFVTATASSVSITFDSHWGSNNSYKGFSLQIFQLD